MRTPEVSGGEEFGAVVQGRDEESRLFWCFSFGKKEVRRMPFMHGSVPLRRTFYYLKQGKIHFRDNVRVRPCYLFELCNAN